MGLALDALGTWTAQEEFTVEGGRALAYAAATNDDNPRVLAGELAPPVFAVVPVWGVLGRAVLGLLDALPPEERQQVALRVVHGEHDMFLHQPLRPGATLLVRAMPLGVHVKASGTTVVIKAETLERGGELVNEQYATLFYRGFTDTGSGGEAAPPREAGTVDPETPRAVVRQRVDEDQTYRYAEASGDHMPIHLDNDVARAVGLPGIIVHGMCTMAFVSRAVTSAVAGGDPARLKRLGMRFARPVFPGDEIVTRLWPAGERDGRAVYALETTRPGGEVVVRNALAEVAP